MLQIADQNAQRMGIDNISFQQADVHVLPFDDESFDRVTCRAGIMYFWDCQRALAEIRRVLRPNGVAALVAWGPVEQSPFVTDFLGPFMMRREMPEIPEDAPHPMRFGAPGSLSSEMNRAGFRSVLEETRIEELPWPGPPEELWQHVYEIAVPMQPYFDSFSGEVREAAIREVIANCSKHWDGKYTRGQSAINIVSGKR
jgi:SAM-dependent methyltransferase